MDDSWKDLRLSLERPYKDDLGNPLPLVLDILPTGEHIFEPYAPWPDLFTSRSHRLPATMALPLS